MKDKFRVFNTINRSKLICMLLLPGRKHVTNKKKRSLNCNLENSLNLAEQKVNLL